MATGDVKTFDIQYTGLMLQVSVIDLGDGNCRVEVKCLDGSADINALYWSDGDTTAGEDTFDGFSAKGDSALNMNGSGIAWDGGLKLSNPGLGPLGWGKETALTAGESYITDVNLDFASLETFGVRATSTSSPGGSIKGVACDPVETPAPKVSAVDAACVVEGGDSVFTISLDQVYAYDVQVTYATAGGTATEGADYTGETGVVTIPAGELSADVVIATIDDTADEADEEHFSLTITSVTLDIPGADLVSETEFTADNSAEGCIQDNDTSGGGGPTGDPDNFPDFTKPDISHVTFYFETDVGDKNGDGWFTVKFDVSGDDANDGTLVSNDLDAWSADALEFIEAEYPDLDMDTLAGVAIKGGNGGDNKGEYWYEYDGVPGTPPLGDDSAEAPLVFPVVNKDVDYAYTVENTTSGYLFV